VYFSFKDRKKKRRRSRAALKYGKGYQAPRLYFMKFPCSQFGKVQSSMFNVEVIHQQVTKLGSEKQTVIWTSGLSH
jgi:hypothetical protein